MLHLIHHINKHLIFYYSKEFFLFSFFLFCFFSLLVYNIIIGRSIDENEKKYKFNYIHLIFIVLSFFVVVKFNNNFKTTEKDIVSKVKLVDNEETIDVVVRLYSFNFDYGMGSISSNLVYKENLRYYDNIDNFVPEETFYYDYYDFDFGYIEYNEDNTIMYVNYYNDFYREGRNVYLRLFDGVNRIVYKEDLGYYDNAKLFSERFPQKMEYDDLEFDISLYSIGTICTIILIILQIQLLFIVNGIPSGTMIFIIMKIFKIIQMIFI